MNINAEKAKTYFESGENYYYGIDCIEDYKLAAEQYYAAAELGHVGAMSRLGSMNLWGEYFEQDYFQALDWFCEARLNGSKEDNLLNDIKLCLEIIANDWRENKMVEGCSKVILFSDSHQLNSAELIKIGAVYQHGFPTYNLAPNLNEAINWWKKASVRGSQLAEKLIRIFGDYIPSCNTENKYPDSNESIKLNQKEDSTSSADFGSIMLELNSLVGLNSIKADVSNLISLVKMQKIRESKCLRPVPVSKHLVFAGNPGTGKTTIARILAQIYKEIGVLSQGQLIEVSRADLVAGYVGQTAIKTQEKINEAIGGILFIDEAYTLAKEGNDFGQEAIDTILKAMEDYRDQFVVIVAGYTNLMEKFINSNPGLKSRFSKVFIFEDYTAQELIAIFDTMCSKYDYKITTMARNIAVDKISEMEHSKGANFANARDVRNYFELVVTRQAARVAFLKNPSDTDIITITDKDV